MADGYHNGSKAAPIEAYAAPAAVAAGGKSLASLLSGAGAGSGNGSGAGSGRSGAQKSLLEAVSVRTSANSLDGMSRAANPPSWAPGRSGQSIGGPFATEKTSREIVNVFDNLDRQLTGCMTEKTSLQEENERSAYSSKDRIVLVDHAPLLPFLRLLQRGLKTLKDRTRQQQIEFRLEELGKEISSLRKQLSVKPS
jgi:hypothetical protein